MLEYGKKYRWKDIEKTYPDMYAIITNVKRKNYEIESCTLLEIVTFEEANATIDKYQKLGISYECRRTTFNEPNSI